MLTQVYLKECVTYHPKTGDLVWRERPEAHFKGSNSHRLWNTNYAHKRVGCEHSSNCKVTYLRTKINSKAYMVHRLIWLHEHGVWPEEIDHVDGDGLNNRLHNLRSISRFENSRINLHRYRIQVGR